MAINTLQTRLQLKYDSYANWTDESVEGKGGKLVLLKGELGICEIPSGNANATTAPTVLFKVGDGTSTFAQLQWASAKAADVYGWAKAATVAIDDETGIISFKKADGSVIETIDLSKYVTSITGDLASRIADLEDAVTGDAGTQNQLAALDERLDTIEGDATKEGSIKKALADAKAYADQAEADAVASANAYADGKAATNKGLIDDVAADVAEHATTLSTHTTNIQSNANAITRVETEYKAADEAINKKLGGNYSETATVADAIADAKKAGTDADTRIDNLLAEDGQIGINKKKTEDNASAISGLTTDISNEATARENADTALSNRLVRVEAFFETTEGETLDGALDRLVELQDYLEEHETVADGMLDKLGEHDTALASLNSMVKDLEAGTNLKTKFESIDGQISDLTDDVTALQSVTKGYTTEGSIKTAVDAAKEQADKGVNDAASAKSVATDAQTRVGTLEGKVNNETTGLAATYDKATTNAADIKSLQELTNGLPGRVQNAEKAIDDLEDVVVSGADANSKLREAITSLQSITSDASSGNAKLRSDLTTLADIVNNSTTGLAAAHTKIENHEGRIAAIEQDYLKAADQFVLQCGTATTNIQVPAQG